MRVFILLAMFFVTACSSVPDANQQAINQVKSFYSFYLRAFVSNSPPPLQSPEMRRYVAADTLAQLERINLLPEPDYFNADYFTYSQDYDPAWIPALKVGLQLVIKCHFSPHGGQNIRQAPSCEGNSVTGST